MNPLRIRGASLSRFDRDVTLHLMTIMRNVYKSNPARRLGMWGNIFNKPRCFEGISAKLIITNWIYYFEVNSSMNVF